MILSAFIFQKVLVQCGVQHVNSHAICPFPTKQSQPELHPSKSTESDTEQNLDLHRQKCKKNASVATCATSNLLYPHLCFC